MSRGARWVLVALGILIFRLGLAGTLIRRSRQGLRVLLYHSVAPRTAPFTEDLDQPIPVADFERHLKFITRYYHPVTLSEVEAGVVPQNAVLVTFDDGYRSLHMHARAPLRAHRISPTVFLIGKTVGNAEMAWTHELAWALHRQPTVVREILEEECPGATDVSMRALLHRLWSTLSAADITRILGRVRTEIGYDPSHVARAERLYLDWPEVARLEGDGWVFGSHTARHFSLAGMSVEDQEQEIRQGIELISAEIRPAAAFAYPFGEHDENARAAAIRAGARCIMQVGGVNPRPIDLTRLARVPVQGVSTTAELFAEIEVVAPLKAWIRRVLR